MICYTDSSYRNSEDKIKSIGGRFIALANDSGEFAPLMWKSMTIQQVFKKVKSAETRSLERGPEDSIYLSRLIKEIYSGRVGEEKLPVEARMDSKYLLDSINIKNKWMRKPRTRSFFALNFFFIQQEVYHTWRCCISNN